MALIEEIVTYRPVSEHMYVYKYMVILYATNFVNYVAQAPNARITSCLCVNFHGIELFEASNVSITSYLEEAGLPLYNNEVEDQHNIKRSSTLLNY